jgi:hypothetical protein
MRWGFSSNARPSAMLAARPLLGFDFRTGAVCSETTAQPHTGFRPLRPRVIAPPNSPSAVCMKRAKAGSQGTCVKPLSFISRATQYELGQVIPRSRAKAIELYRASGDQDALWIAQVLADPKTPARFAGETALDQYLAGVRSAEIAAAWARAHPSAGNSGGGMPHMVTADQAAVMKWEREGKNGPNPLSR